MTTRPALTTEESCRQLFGEHPEDVIRPIKSAADALGWLEEIFAAIQRETLDGGSVYRIKRLAEMGAYMALDMGNCASCQHETLIDRLRAASVVELKGAAA